MFEMLEQQDGVLEIHATGKLTHADYQYLIPKLEALLAKESKGSVLFVMEKEFQGWEPSAFWDDLSFGLKHRNDYGKCGVVGGPKWVEWVMKAFAPLMSGEMKTFSAEQLDEARAWAKE